MISEYLKKGGILALILAAVALLSAGVWTGENATVRALAHHGVATTAFVVQKHPVTDGDGARYEVTYLYQSLGTDGTRRTHRVEHQVPQSVYDGARVGSQVQVRYLPEDPAQAEVYPGEYGTGMAYLNILSLVAAAAAMIAAMAGLQLARREPMLAQPA